MASDSLIGPSNPFEPEQPERLVIPVTPSLALRELRVEDSVELNDLLRRNEQFLRDHFEDTPDKYPDLASLEARNAVSQPGLYRFGLWRGDQRHGHMLIGFARAEERDPLTIEVGYWMGEEYQGSGYMTKTVVALRDWLTGTLGYPRVIAHVHNDNRDSQGVLERAGFTFGHPDPESEDHGYFVYETGMNRASARDIN